MLVIDKIIVELCFKIWHLFYHYDSQMLQDRPLITSIFAHKMPLKSEHASVVRLAFWGSFNARITQESLAQERDTLIDCSSVCVIANFPANSIAVAP